MNNSNFNWHSFWKDYRNIDFKSEDDLFIQVGKTVNGQPISRLVFMAMIEDIASSLELNSSDTMLEMCCGNGLLTLPLSEFVNEVVAFDFTDHLIATAQKFRTNSKITYRIADANSNFFEAFALQRMPNKFLMNDSLGYFTLQELKAIIVRIMDNSDHFRFYITGVPNDALKWNFYNTEERKQAYIASVNAGETSGKGIGHWWDMQLIQQLADELSLICTISNQPESISNYRTNILLCK